MYVWLVIVLDLFESGDVRATYTTMISTVALSI